MDKNHIKNELAKIKQLGSKDERDRAMDRILSDIEDRHFHSVSQEEKEQLNNLSSSVQEYMQHHENGPALLHDEIMKKHTEITALEVECAKLQSTIERVQAEHRQATLRRDHRKSQLKILQEAAEFFDV